MSKPVVFAGETGRVMACRGLRLVHGVGEVVADGAVCEVESACDVGDGVAFGCFEEYLREIWRLQYQEPAANDALLRALPDSQQVLALCDQANTVAQRLLGQAQATGRIRSDITSDEVYQLIWERGVIARAWGDRPEEDYIRLSELTLNGLRHS